MSHSFVKRRLWWKDVNQAVIDFGNAQTPDLVTFRWSPFLVSGDYEANNDKPVFIYHLLYDGKEMGTYKSLAALKKWLIESAYGIKKELLIPSELLYDADLGYLNVNLWVDDWTSRRTASLNEEVLEGIEDVEPPIDRRIRLVTDSGTRAATMRRRTPNKVPRKSKTETLIEEMERIMDTHEETRGNRWPKSKAAPFFGGSSPYPAGVTVYKSRAKKDIYPARPLDGSFFSPVKIDWEDESWEARCSWRKPSEAEVPDADCYFVLAAENDQESS